MAIKKFSDYEETKPYGDFQPLPTGGYVLKITGVKGNKDEDPDYYIVNCDIADGDYKGYFMDDYQAQTGDEKKWHCNYLLNVPTNDGSERDNWTKRRFKTFTAALEDSNDGYHFDWDEKQFVGKLIGGLFNEREYRKLDGSIGRVTNLARVCPTEKIRSGSYKLPKDKLLEGEAAKGVGDPDFMNVAESESEVPFD